MASSNPKKGNLETYERKRAKNKCGKLKLANKLRKFRQSATEKEQSIDHIIMDK